MSVSHPLVNAILAKNRRAIARGITIVENDQSDKSVLLEQLYPHTGKAYVIGITGSPGAGKSSLVDRLLTLLRSKQLSIAVIAVDPTSPFTGGALLGDRVRMSNHYTDPDIFIRSMGTRGSLGGLARASKEATRIFDAAGYDIILVETVGVGQSELDIMHVADTTLVVLTPGAGDTIQAFKAGIMEIADGYIVNKADLPGTDKLIAEVESMLDLAKHDSPWRPPIVKTISRDNGGIQEMWDMIESHRNYLHTSNEGYKRRETQLKKEVYEIALHQMTSLVERKLRDRALQEQLQKVAERDYSPYLLANEVKAAIAREVVANERDKA